MKKNLFLAAMALPLAFASCSQEEIVSNGFDSNVPDNAIKGLVLGMEKNAIFEGAESRANWNDAQTKLEFVNNDKVSIYWLGNDNATFVVDDGNGGTTDETAPKYSRVPASTSENLEGKFNTVFNTSDEGKSFTTQSMVFEGGNVAVFPADLAFYNQGQLYLEVSAEQDASVQDKLPYISNQLYIAKRTEQTEQLPGYYGEGDKLYAPLKQAANIVNLKLELSNIPANMNFEVQSVELISIEATPAFASKSKIQRLAKAPTTAGKVAYKNGSTASEAETLISQVWTTADKKEQTLKSTALEVNGTNVIARFVVLPTDVEYTTDDVAIKVNTNCGYILLTQDGSEATIANGGVRVMGGKDNEEGLTIAKAFNQFVASYEDERAKETFSGEQMGKVMDRSIAVDVNKAVLNGSEVYSSADIVRYAGLYVTMGKKNITGQDDMNLVMVSAAKDGKFPALTKAAVDALAALNSTTTEMTLTPSLDSKENGGVTTIEVTGGGEVFDIPMLASGATSVIVLDNSAAWSMNDNFEFTEPNVSMQNNGTLTINGGLRGDDPAQGKLIESVYNNGTINIGGNDILLVGANLTTSASSTINVAADQTLTFADNISTGLYGTINVNGKTSFLTFAAGINVTHNGTINNYGTIASIEAATAAGLINASYNHDSNPATANVGGVINVMSADAITYVYNNTNGTIVMADRTNEVKASAGYEGKIVYNYTTEDGDVFKLTADDRFTYVKFGADITNMTLYKVTADDGYVAPTNISMEFAGVTTLKSDNVTIDDLVVATGANLRVLSGNILNVSTLDNNGTITIGGVINAATDPSNEEKGNVVSMGGAIK